MTGVSTALRTGMICSCHAAVMLLAASALLLVTTSSGGRRLELLDSYSLLQGNQSLVDEAGLPSLPTDTHNISSPDATTSLTGDTLNRSVTDPPTMAIAIASSPPSIGPTAAISSERPTLMPSFSPTLVASDQPSETPSSIPSSLPTPLPSVSPSAVSSLVPSFEPTKAASMQPSEVPSSVPSSGPTSLPSAFPSETPSSSPTLECHDQQSYRSPINNLTCEDHQGTNCVHWRILGLNTTELAKLIEQCPETCLIPCGAFVQFSVSLRFTIAGIPGLMDANTKKDLEVVTRQHQLAYIRAKLDRQISFEFDSVELVSQAVLQDIPSGNPPFRQRQLDNAASTTTLEVRMEFQGFAVGISHRDASKLLIAGIDSESFKVALQTAGDFFATAVVLSAAVQDVPTRTSKDERTNKGVLPATIVLSMLFAVLVSVLGAWSWIYHRRSGKWLPRLRVFSCSDIDENFQVHSPMRFTRQGTYAMTSLPGRHNMFSIANTDSMLSFDDSRASTLQAGNGAPFLRLLARMSLSRSQSSADMEEGMPGDDTAFPTEKMSSCSNEEIPVEHPLSDIIPPMIVIDHIDDENPEIGIVFRSKTPQVPAKMVHASEDLISALREGQSPEHHGMLNWGSVDFGTDFQNGWHCLDDTRPFSPLGLVMDSDSDDDVSVASTPVRSKRNRDAFRLRRSLSSSALDERPGENVHPISIFSSEPTIGLFAGKAARHNVEKRGIASILGTRRETPGGGHPSAKKDIGLPPLAIKDTAPKSSKKTAFSKMVDFGTLKLQQVPASLDRPNHDTIGSLGIITSSGVTDLCTEARDDKPTRYEFEAPRKGQLGIIIESDAVAGPVVRAVKDYSPLLGLIQRGDRIVEVNGRNTSRCTLTDISRLLSIKPSLRNGGHANFLKIAVTRSPVRDASRSQRGSPPRVFHSRDSSYGSSSIASSSRLGPSSSFDDGSRPSDQSTRHVSFGAGPSKGPNSTYHESRLSF